MLLHFLLRAPEDMLEEAVDGKIYIAVIPGRHFVEAEDVVVLRPAAVLPAGDVDVLHVALVAHQDDGLDWLVSEFHCIDVISEPGSSAEESLSSDEEIFSQFCP